VFSWLPFLGINALFYLFCCINDFWRTPSPKLYLWKSRFLSWPIVFKTLGNPWLCNLTCAFYAFYRLIYWMLNFFNSGFWKQSFVFFSFAWIWVALNHLLSVKLAANFLPMSSFSWLLCFRSIGSNWVSSFAFSFSFF